MCARLSNPPYSWRFPFHEANPRYIWRTRILIIYLFSRKTNQCLHFWENYETTLVLWILKLAYMCNYSFMKEKQCNTHFRILYTSSEEPFGYIIMEFLWDIITFLWLILCLEVNVNRVLITTVYNKIFVAA